MPPLTPNPQALYDAGKKTVDASVALHSALQALLGALGSSGGMCGDDPAGIGVAQTYDKASKALVLALVDTVNGTARIGDGCQASAANYANAHHASSMGPSSATPLEFPTPTSPKSAKLPPSAQGGHDVPAWQRALEVLSGVFGPNGDPGKLQAAAGSWRQMAEACHIASAAVAGPKDVAAEQAIPEVDKMDAAYGTAITSLDTAAAQCASVAEKLDAQAAQINSTRAAIHDLASKLGDPGSLLQSGLDWLRGKGAGVLHEVLRDLDVIVGGFRTELSSLAHLLEPLVEQAEEFARKMAGYAEMAVQQVENLAYNVAAEAVNTAATWGYAAATHPGDVLMVAGGLALAEAGMGGEVGGVALDATGVGAVVGIPAGVVSAAAIAVGVTSAGAGVYDIGEAASKHEVTVMETRTGPRLGEGIDRGDGRDIYGQWANGNKGGGKQAEARGIKQYQQDNPGEWVTREQRLARVNGAENGRYYDGLAKKPDGTYKGIEVKSGTASLTPEQRAFDGAVSAENPAYVTITNERGEVETVKVTEVEVRTVPAQ